MARLRSPLIWYGGKGMMVSKLLPLLPPHRTYVEVFGGGASLLFAKSPSPVEVYNDIDGNVVNFFTVLRDEEKFKRFKRMCEATPYSRRMWKECKERMNEGDDVERAWRFFVAVRQSQSACGGWSCRVEGVTGGMARGVSAWLATVDGLHHVHDRLRRVQIECDDFRRIIERYDYPDCLFYCDPPYVQDSRAAGVPYADMTLEDHKELVDLLLSIEGMAMLSGYKHEVYLPLEEAGWKRYDFETSCHAVGRTRGTGVLGEGSATAKYPRVESVWVSPSAQKRKGTLF